MIEIPWAVRVFGFYHSAAAHTVPGHARSYAVSGSIAAANHANVVTLVSRSRRELPLDLLLTPP